MHASENPTDIVHRHASHNIRLCHTRWTYHLHLRGYTHFRIGIYEGVKKMAAKHAQGICAFGSHIVKAAHTYRRIERRNGGNGISNGINGANMDAIADARAAARKHDLPENRLVYSAIISMAAAFAASQAQRK